MTVRVTSSFTVPTPHRPLNEIVIAVRPSREPGISIAEHRQPVHGFAFGVDRLALALWVLAPVGDEAPTQLIERNLPGFVITPDHQQILAGRAVPTRREIVDAGTPLP
jgi:hypothetical protein